MELLFAAAPVGVLGMFGLAVSFCFYSVRARLREELWDEYKSLLKYQRQWSTKVSDQYSVEELQRITERASPSLLEDMSTCLRLSKDAKAALEGRLPRRYVEDLFSQWRTIAETVAYELYKLERDKKLSGSVNSSTHTKVKMKVGTFALGRLSYVLDYRGIREAYDTKHSQKRFMV